MSDGDVMEYNKEDKILSIPATVGTEKEIIKFLKDKYNNGKEAGAKDAGRGYTFSVNDGQIIVGNVLEEDLKVLRMELGAQYSQFEKMEIQDTKKTVLVGNEKANDGAAYFSGGKTTEAKIQSESAVEQAEQRRHAARATTNVNTALDTVLLDRVFKQEELNTFFETVAGDDKKIDAVELKKILANPRFAEAVKGLVGEVDVKDVGALGKATIKLAQTTSVVVAEDVKKSYGL